MKLLHSLIYIISFLFCGIVSAQDNDSVLISTIYREALSNDWAYRTLEDLCKTTPHRLAGSEGVSKAISRMYQKIAPFADTVYLQSVMAKHWSRGKKEEAVVIIGKEKRSIAALALGGSVGTGKAGLKANVVEVHSFAELKQLGKTGIQGKMVFYNFAMDPMDMVPGRQYGKTVFQRFFGAEQAAYYGAVGTIVRSLTNIPDKNPHTGIMRYVDSIPKIPAIAISTLDADELSRDLKLNSSLEFFMRTGCEMLPDVPSYNLIAEIRGNEIPKEVITVGGHIDSWDVGEGAHDDGVGCVHSMEVLRLIHTLKIKPKRTIRMVLFLDEEMFQVGARRYAEWVKERNEKIYAAIESDSGGSLPIGFSCTADSAQYLEFQKLKSLFVPYGINRFRNDGGGVDIDFLADMHVPLLDMNPDPQRYFEYHHSANDIFEKVSFRDLQLGSATITAMIVMLDKHDSFK